MITAGAFFAATYPPLAEISPLAVFSRKHPPYAKPLHHAVEAGCARTFTGVSLSSDTKSLSIEVSEFRIQEVEEPDDTVDFF
jgi:hypothetical protein